MPETLLKDDQQTDEHPHFSRAAALQNYIEVNSQINDWYRNIDKTLRLWTGEPQVANWASFAKIISFNAAIGAKQMSDTLEVLDHICDMNEVIKMHKQSIWRRDVLDLGRQIVGCMTEGIKLLVRDLKSGAAPIKTIGKLKGIQLVETESDHLENFIWPDRIHSKVRPCEIPKIVFQVFKHPELFKKAIEQIMNAVEDANKAIYQYMSVNFAIIEEAIKNNPDADIANLEFVDDEKGFFKAAMCEYQKVRLLGGQLADHRIGSDEWCRIMDLRDAAVRRANLLVTFNEQAFRVQPRYKGLERIIDVIFYDARIVMDKGSFELLSQYDEGNWAHVITKMGLCPDGIEDINDITPEKFPETLPSDDPRYLGTIAAYFDDAYRNPDKLNYLFSN